MQILWRNWLKLYFNKNNYWIETIITWDVSQENRDFYSDIVDNNDVMFVLLTGLDFDVKCDACFRGLNDPDKEGTVGSRRQGKPPTADSASQR